MILLVRHQLGLYHSAKLVDLHLIILDQIRSMLQLTERLLLLLHLFLSLHFWLGVEEYLADGHLEEGGSRAFDRVLLVLYVLGVPETKSYVGYVLQALF